MEIDGKQFQQVGLTLIEDRVDRINGDGTRYRSVQVGTMEGRAGVRFARLEITPEGGKEAQFFLSIDDLERYAEAEIDGVEWTLLLDAMQRISQERTSAITPAGGQNT
jgi:hypothetical protein